MPHLHLPHVPMPHIHHTKKSPAPAQTQNAPAAGENENAPASDQDQGNASSAQDQSGSTQTQATITGPTAFGQVAATSTNLGTVYNAGVGLGWNFSDHFGADVGFTLYTVQSPYSIVLNHDWRWSTLLGDPFIDVRYATHRGGMDFDSVLTGTIPLSSPERVFTTGRFGVDWFNHIQTSSSYMGFQPFVNFGAANETVDRYILPRPYDIARPYQALGFMSTFEAGGNFTILHHYSIGASAYAMVPAGTQKVFSRLVASDSTISGDANHNRYWNNAFETIGNSAIDRDNGYSGWLDVHRFPNLTIELGYTFSEHYKLGTTYIMLRYDGTSLLRFLTATQ